MKAKFGAIVTDGRGKAGGHVFTKNRQGAAMRTKVTPINRRSTSQQNARSFMSTISQAWRSLTQASRDAWTSAALDVSKSNIFGDKYHPTGKNFFTELNTTLLSLGQSVNSNPPAMDAAPALDSIAIASLTNAAMTVSFAPTPVPADTVLVLEGTRPISQGSNTGSSQFRKFATVNAAGTSPANVYSAYVAKFGAPQTDKKVFIRAYFVNTVNGIKSIPLQASAIVA